jgi:hypothetical protein
MELLGCHIGAKDSIRIGHTQIEFHVFWLIIIACGTRDVLTFVDRILFSIWRTYGAISGQKTPFGFVRHTPSGMGTKKVQNTPPVGHRPAECVSVIGPNVFPPVPNRWPPKKGNNFGQQKSTRPEISRSRKKNPSRFYPLWVDFC